MKAPRLRYSISKVASVAHISASLPTPSVYLWRYTSRAKACLLGIAGYQDPSNGGGANTPPRATLKVLRGTPHYFHTMTDFTNTSPSGQVFSGSAEVMPADAVVIWAWSNSSNDWLRQSDVVDYELAAAQVQAIQAQCPEARAVFTPCTATSKA